jgi:hypothetical protein
MGAETAAVPSDCGALPTFLVIGAMKAGTTSLWRYLRAHPDVFLPDEKEPDFFVAEKTWNRGLDWYRSLFADGTGAAARGEASTNYTKDPLFTGVPGRIASVVPGVKLVYVVRDPMERIVSHYRHALRAGWETRPLDEVLLADRQYVDISSYARQLRLFLEHFPREQVLVVTAEDLRDHRDVTVGKVLAFLGVEPTIPREAIEDEHHTAPVQSPRRSIASFVDSLPGRDAIRRVLPGPLRRAYTRATALDHPDRMELSDSTRERVLAELRRDTADLRALTGIHGWAL